MSLGRALKDLGADVEFYSFDNAFLGKPVHSRTIALQFPWKLSMFLKRHAREFDVIDASTGDAWPWLTWGRPNSRRRQVVVTHSHGLEHMVDRAFRARAARGETRLSWKYPLYHGGLKLWEVEQSIKKSDHLIVLNELDRSFAQSNFGLSEERISVIPNGIAEAIQRVELPPAATEHRLNAVFIGSWLDIKGISHLISTTTALFSEGLLRSLRLVGTRVTEETVLSSFPRGMRSIIRVVPSYSNLELPRLVVGADVLFQLSLSEGFSLALIEGMACGLIPIATPVGGASSVISDGNNGFIVPVGDANASTQAARRLALDTKMRCDVRGGAKETSHAYTWLAAAQHTVAVYTGMLARNYDPRWLMRSI